MARKTLKGTTAFEMFGNFFKICQEYWTVEPNENEQYWEELFKAVAWFLDRYKEEPFAYRMIMSFLEWKEEENRNEIKQKIMKEEKV